MTSSFQPHSTRIRMSSGRSDRVAGRRRSIVVVGGGDGGGGGVGVGEVGMRCWLLSGWEVKASAELGQTWTTLSPLDMSDLPNNRPSCASSTRRVYGSRSAGGRSRGRGEIESTTRSAHFSVQCRAVGSATSDNDGLRPTSSQTTTRYDDDGQTSSVESGAETCTSSSSSTQQVSGSCETTASRLVAVAWLRFRPLEVPIAWI
jgi:hypothetical protein